MSRKTANFWESGGKVKKYLFEDEGLYFFLQHGKQHKFKETTTYYFNAHNSVKMSSFFLLSYS